ncbi:MAG: hydrogenobyrinic acid a,c-diamide synthase (glutamine-hydrolyzing), partial [Candidatus Riflebacteria bacterium]|nr:hydrogenobyrinic acid a,c-diamide synthase (glutamine-hydrolyzing) [Candidatus Riflebacteria bacterium]
NRCGTARQERVIREAVATDVGLPVLGALPRLESQYLPGRHLGLVPAAEHPGSDEIADALASIVEQRTDVPKILALAGRASRPQADPALEGLDPPAGARPGRRVRIGVLRDRAFSFYYPENLEALETAGGQLVFISPLDDESVPDIEALYAGGGFPEVHAAGLSENRSMRDSLRTRIAEGLPVWAECGGLMYLSRFIDTNGARYPMVGAVPCLIEQTPRPQGHGYVEASVDRVNPFLAEGVSLKGHEFHYSHVIGNHDDLATVMAVHRGIGVGNGRDGIRVGNVVASYTHLHSLGVPSLAGGIVSAALGGVA